MNFITELHKGYAEMIDDIRYLHIHRRLTNPAPMIFTPNCLGGYIYHWMRHEFLTPTVNLTIPLKGYLTALENLEEFLDSDIKEDRAKSKELGVPTGIGAFGVEILFSHYGDFSEGIGKWNARKARILRKQNEDGTFRYDTDRIWFILNVGGMSREDLIRFDSLPFPHKTAFVENNENMDIGSCVHIENYDYSVGLWNAQHRWSRKRYLDQYDWVGKLNECGE